jgi:anti-anti-sigma factor
MKTTVTEQDGKLVAILEGTLDTAAAEKTARDLAPLNDSKGRDILIDCSKLTYISSSGLRILLSVRKHASVAGSSVTLKGANNDILDVLRTTGFNNLFTII